MKTVINFALLMLLVALPAAGAADPPRELAGFMLGGQVSDIKHLVQMETALPIRYMECLKEVEIRDNPAFKSGLIAFGTCARPGRIVRIKLKYADASRSFYDSLLSRFKKRFGEPTEWQGDPFHVVIEWKWSFVDEKNNRISLRLSHNSLDREEKFGNAVKLTLTNAIREELDCFRLKHPDFRNPEPPGKAASGKKPDWEELIPR